MTLRLILWVVCCAALAACGPAPALPTVVPVTATPEVVEGDSADLADELQLGEPAGGFMSVTLSGAAEGLFAGSGGYGCVNGVEQLSVTDPASVMVFGLQPGTVPGEITVDSNDATVTVAVLADEVGEVSEYFGIFTLNAAPSAAGDAVQGSFDITLLTAGGEQVSAVGTFDVIAGSVCS